ncbi:MAG: hypothetical protein LBG30_00310 [Odoribacteraceae bacterium]|jgi:hypothetical protein|nr:hypothetical protein [Odoribacteraceae bacterium]
MSTVAEHFGDSTKHFGDSAGHFGDSTKHFEEGDRFRWRLRSLRDDRVDPLWVDKFSSG